MRLFFTFFFSFFCLFAFSQKATISGYVEEASTGEKLIGASVYDSKTHNGTTTNVYGFFSLTLNEADIDLIVSYIGFTTFKQSINLKSDRFLNVQLSSNNELEEVVVSASASEKIHEMTQMSTVKLQMKQIEKLPSFMGERDILKSIQLLPGIQSASEDSSGLYVRGGGPA